MGKVLGGGSSINVSTWSRGHQAEWDYYASESADLAWNYEAILNLYRDRIEAWAGNPDPDFRGQQGKVHVQPNPERHDFSNAFLEGAQSLGIEKFPNANGRMMESGEGCSFVDETIHEGARRSIFRSDLYPMMYRRNVTVLTGALVTRVIIEKNRARGVEFQLDGKKLRVDATNEVILSLGAIQTPKLLMQSGIGDEDELKNANVPIIQSLSGVGRNLHDHVSIGLMWENTDLALPEAP